MQRQSVLTDVGALSQAGAHHVPADQALDGAQRKNCHELQAKAARDGAGCQEQQERQGKGDTDQASKVSVCPFPPEDDLEGLEAHALIDMLILRNLLVFAKLLLPVLFG